MPCEGSVPLTFALNSDKNSISLGIISVNVFQWIERLLETSKLVNCIVDLGIV